MDLVVFDFSHASLLLHFVIVVAVLLIINNCFVIMKYNLKLCLILHLDISKSDTLTS